MLWTSINQDLCSQCGVCISRCVRNYREENGEILSYAKKETCSLCGHCVALCPTEAITHHQMNMDNFIEFNREQTISTDDFVHFVRGRRSHRKFLDKEVSQKDLETLIDLCRYAPTGTNKQMLEIMVLRDKEKIKRLSNHTIDSFENNIGWMAGEVEKYKLDGKEVPQLFISALSMTDTLDLVVKARQFGFDGIFHEAPVVLIFHSPAETSSPKDDCVIAATTITLAATTMKLATCYIGLFEFVANIYEPIIKELNLPIGNKVYSILILGYPDFEFYRTVDRKAMTVQWF